MIISLLEKSAISNKWVAIIAIAVIIAMIIILVMRNKQKKKEQNLTNAYVKKKREEELEKKLRNEDKEKVVMQSRPYEVSYEHSESAQGQDAIKKEIVSAIKLQLTVKSEFSTKKYLLDVVDQVSIGRKRTNEIVLDDKNVSGTHCALINREGLLYVCDLNSTNGSTLVRKSKRIQVGNNPVRITEGDQLLIAGNTVTISFI